MKPLAGFATLLLLAPAAGIADADSIQLRWDALAPMPGPRGEVGAAAVLGKIWVVGGLGPGAGTGKRVDVYDPATDSWASGPALPRDLHHTAAVAVGTFLVVIGGYAGSSWVPTAEAWFLQTALPRDLQSWRALPPMPVARGAHAAVSDGANVYVFGGVNKDGKLETTAVKLVGLPGLPLPLWLPMPPFPDPRDHLTGALLDGKVHAIAGRDQCLCSNTARVDVYDPILDRWVQGADLRLARGGIAAAVAAGRIFSYGGEAWGGTIGEVEAFDPVSGAWSIVGRLPHARHGLGAAAVGDDVYVVSGGLVPGYSYSGYNERMRLL